MKLAASILASAALANTVDPEISALYDGCIAVADSSAFDGKTGNKSISQFRTIWARKCSRQASRLAKLYDRCGEYVNGYQVVFNENPETEPCKAVSERAVQNIDWLTAHVTTRNCAARVSKVSEPHSCIKRLYS